MSTIKIGTLNVNVAELLFSAANSVSALSGYKEENEHPESELDELDQQVSDFTILGATYTRWETRTKGKVMTNTHPTAYKAQTGPFDIIGDIHGCYDELTTLLTKLGYVETSPQLATHAYEHPDRRKLVFVGDYVDRGPASDLVIDLAMTSIAYGSALGVLGNHDDKFRRYLMGRNVKIAHGLNMTIEQIAPHSEEWRAFMLDYLNRLPHHLILDNGKLVVAHAGLEEQFFGATHGAAISMALYGKTTGAFDEHGLPVRLHWEDDYSGDATVVFGHTPVGQVSIVNKTYNIDTGAVFGGSLTCLRYPEMELVSVPALQQYAEPRKPLA